MDVVISDFDDTLFKRNFGLINRTVDYLEKLNLPVYIVTFRAQDQLDFISSTLSHTELNVVGYGFAESRKKEPSRKLAIMQDIARRNNVVEVLDDDRDFVVYLKQHGFNAHHISQV